MANLREDRCHGAAHRLYPLGGNCQSDNGDNRRDPHQQALRKHSTLLREEIQEGTGAHDCNASEGTKLQQFRIPGDEVFGARTDGSCQDDVVL